MHSDSNRPRMGITIVNYHLLFMRTSAARLSLLPFVLRLSPRMSMCPARAGGLYRFQFDELVVADSHVSQAA